MVAAVLPPAKKAMQAAFKIEGALSLNDATDACYPHYLLWGMSLAGAAMVGCALPALAGFVTRTIDFMAKKLVLIGSSRSRTITSAIFVDRRPIACKPKTDSPNSSASSHVDKGHDTKKQNHSRDSTTFTYVQTNDNNSRDRMSLDLCMGESRACTSPDS